MSDSIQLQKSVPKRKVETLPLKDYFSQDEVLLVYQLFSRFSTTSRLEFIPCHIMEDILRTRLKITTFAYSGSGVTWKEFTLKDGKKHGLETWWYENGKKESEQMWKNDDLNGLEAHWYDSGQKEIERMWKDGMRNGLEVRWYESGQKEIERMLKDGMRNGLEVRWYESGQKEIEQMWMNNKIIK